MTSDDNGDTTQASSTLLPDYYHIPPEEKDDYFTEPWETTTDFPIYPLKEYDYKDDDEPVYYENALDQLVAPGLRLWMLLAMLMSVLLLMGQYASTFLFHIHHDFIMFTLDNFYQTFM